MLSDREERQLRGIESQLSDEAPGLERQMLVHAWNSTPRESAPRLPVVLLILGIVGMLATAFVPTGGGRFLLALGTVTLLGYALFHLPVHPSARLYSTEEEGRGDGS
jgi:Protein of unknown function (DUF3040)